MRLTKQLRLPALVAAAGLALAVLSVTVADRRPDPVDLTRGFYVDPDSAAADWVRDNPDDPRAPRIRSAIASQPMARWFGDWSGDIGPAVDDFVTAADRARRLPVLVAYDIPDRDACGGYSGGGAGSPEAYRSWISAFAGAVRDRPAVVIIEPDSLGDLDCLHGAAAALRTSLLAYAARQFRERAPNTWAYLDAGNANWVPADVMAGRLHRAGLGDVRGFSINVSNYYTTAESVRYGRAVNGHLPGYRKSFVVDTSRNGNGSNGEWCNPAGRRLGVPARVGGGAELLLWIKAPGDSDGSCGVAPTAPAGEFSPDLAVRLIDGV